jgi:hypothetical protein
VRMRDPGAWFESWNCVSTGSCFVRLEVVSIAQYPGHLQRSVEVPSTGFTRPSENPTLFRIARQASSFLDLQRCSALIFSAKDDLWKTRASKWCSLASALIAKGNQSVT